MQEVIFKVLRYNPEVDSRAYFKEYNVPVTVGLTCLDGLLFIKENLDATLSMRYSCRMGICGSCAMIINGKPDLACHLQISHINAKVIRFEPLFNHPLIRDLICDFSLFFERHRKVKPYLIRSQPDEQEKPVLEYKQDPNELEGYLQFSYCLKCGCCFSVCPTAATDKLFLGPQALCSSCRYIIDSRDEGFYQRLAILDSDHSLWNCHFAGSCAHVCPKGVDPALAIQLLKRLFVQGRLGWYKKDKGANIIESPRPNPEKIKKAPKPPPFTI
jgi:succinate dehydrogenase / fumarate reductase iron-sulfur subunit